MRFRRSAAAIVAVLALALVSACNNDKAGQNGDESLQKITYLTSFNTFGREAYAYVALEKGYFKDAGFDVTIKPGSGTVDVLKLVAGGQADYGIGDFTAILLTMGKQKLPVTTVGMIHQRSMAAIVALQGGSITDPQSLAGKKIGDTPGSTNTVTFPLYAKAAKIQGWETTKFVPSPPAALPQLLSAGTVDGIGQFVVGVPTVEKADAKGRHAVVLPYGDYLKNLYGNAIITRSDTAKDHPDQVKKFTTALLKGLQDTIDDPEGAAKILQKYVPERNPEGSVKELNLMKPYVKPEGFNGALGEVDFKDVETIIKDLEDAKQIAPGSVNPSDVVDRDLAPKG